MNGLMKTYLATNLDRHDQDFAEAAVELLILAMYADGKLTMAEREFLDEYGSLLRWQGTTPLDIFTSLAYGRVRQVHASKQRVPFVRAIAAKLPKPQDRIELFNACVKLVKSDGEAPPDEREFLADLKTGFGF
jgi:uncharacterized tellurite resistance protein B-like protein